jgi:hypothetical protein
MEATIRRSAIEFWDKRRLWNKVAWVVWTVVLVVIVLRPLLLSHRGTSFDTYQLAGSRWLRGEDVYSQWMGFVYSPMVAAFFAPFAWLPVSLANILWRILNAALLLGGLAAILKIHLFVGITEKFWPAVYPSGSAGDWKYRYQSANPRWRDFRYWRSPPSTPSGGTARHLGGIATYLKIYPIAVGLLMRGIAPMFQLADADRPFAASHPVRFSALVLCFEPIPCLDCHADIG